MNPHHRIFINSVIIFSLFCNYLHWERAGPFIWTNLNPHHQRLLCAKFGWNWSSGSFNFVNVFSLFCNYLTVEEGMALCLNKLESPSPKDALCQVWLKLAKWFLRRRWKCLQTDGPIDERTDRRTTDNQKRSLELSAQSDKKQYVSYWSGNIIHICLFILVSQLIRPSTIFTSYFKCIFTTNVLSDEVIGVII